MDQRLSGTVASRLWLDLLPKNNPNYIETPSRLSLPSQISRYSLREQVNRHSLPSQVNRHSVWEQAHKNSVWESFIGSSCDRDHFWSPCWFFSNKKHYLPVASRLWLDLRPQQEGGNCFLAHGERDLSGWGLPMDLRPSLQLTKEIRLEVFGSPDLYSFPVWSYGICCTNVPDIP